MNNSVGFVVMFQKQRIYQLKHTVMKRKFFHFSAAYCSSVCFHADRLKLSQKLSQNSTSNVTWALGTKSHASTTASSADLWAAWPTTSFNPTARLKVTNTGYRKVPDGKFKESVGKAYRPDDNVPGKLKVSFFLNFYSEYNVLELAPDYRYALIGSKSDSYLWILSRTPELSQDDLDFLLGSAKARGYDTSKLIWVEHR